jgi:flavin-dependent dehydrogenase
MDYAIVEAAQRAGVCVFDGVNAHVLPDDAHDWREVSASGPNAPRASWRARVIVAADGLGRPSLAALSDFSSRPAVSSRVGFGMTGAIAPANAGEYPAGRLHMAVRPDGYAGVTRVADGRLCIAAAVDPRVVRGRDSLGSWLANATAASGWPDLPGLESAKFRGTPLLTRLERRRAGRRLLLVGDAAGYTEPITGEGMAWALAGASALPDVVVAGLREWGPAIEQRWEQTLDAVVFRRMRLNRFLTTTLRRPALSRAVFAAASLFPSGASAVARRLNRTTQLLERVA